VRDLVLAYYYALRTALRTRQHLRGCLARCRHCRIFFLAHPRNRGRDDLGCPFGCRDAHRRRHSAERSAEYYRTAAGKEKKARLNRNRRGVGPSGAEPEGAGRRGEPDAIELDAGIVGHVRMVASLIEGFIVSREEVVAMLERSVRQRRIARERPRDYVVRWFAENFP
jgi:hypothetical protein